MRRNHNTNRQPSVTRFALGQTFITPGAEEALQIAGQTAIEFLRRHMSCDWGELSADDVRENEFSLKKGFRLLSNYRTVRTKGSFQEYNGRFKDFWLQNAAPSSFAEPAEDSQGSPLARSASDNESLPQRNNRSANAVRLESFNRWHGVVLLRPPPTRLARNNGSVLFREFVVVKLPRSSLR